MKRYFESLVYTDEYDVYTLFKSQVHTMELEDLYTLLKCKGLSDEDIAKFTGSIMRGIYYTEFKEI